MEENSGRYVYLDNIRNSIVYSVVLFHAAVMFAYPLMFFWAVVDKSASSRIYETFMLVCDAFQMPHLMFIAVLFIFPSLKKATVPGYLKKRFLRLMVPVLVSTACCGDIIYQLRYKRAGMAEPPYLDTFIGFWKDLFTGPILTPISIEAYFRPTFMVDHTWFMSFLFAATIVIVLLSKLKGGEKADPENVKTPDKIVFKTTIIFLIFTLAYLAGLIVLAANEIRFTEWVRFGGFFTVRLDQGMQLVLFLVFGLYVCKKEWLIKGDIGTWKFWGVTSLLLLITLVVLLYARVIPLIGKLVVVMDHNLFNHDNKPLPEITDAFKLFMLVRYALALWFCMSLLMFFISLSKCYFNRPNKITAFCSKHSIYVYVLHLWPVMLLQYASKEMTMPSLLKVALITFIVISASLWLSHRLVSPYPKIAISFFVALKTAAIFAGFTFYYYALLSLIFIAFAGAMIESAMYLHTAKQTEPDMISSQ